MLNNFKAFRGICIIIELWIDLLEIEQKIRDVFNYSFLFQLDDLLVEVGKLFVAAVFQNKVESVVAVEANDLFSEVLVLFGVVHMQQVADIVCKFTACNKWRTYPFKLSFVITENVVKGFPHCWEIELVSAASVDQDNRNMDILGLPIISGL